MTKAQRKRTRNIKAKPLTYPIGIEKEYARYLKGALSEFSSRVMTRYSSYIKRNIRLDAANELDAILAQLYAEIDQYYGTTYISTTGIGRVLEYIAQRIFDKDSAFLAKQIEIVAGTPINIATPWWDEAKTLWEQNNYDTIKSLSRDYISKLNTTVINAIQNGITQDQLTEQILKITESLTETKARLFARDQVGKLNSIIAKAQYTSIGMDWYYWVVIDDERLRGSPRGRYPKSIPSHFSMIGLMTDWNDSSVYSDDLGKTWKKKTGKMEPLQVGMAYLCRCTAAPSWNAYLRYIDGEEL